MSEWKIRTQPDYAARKVLERDRGVCALCRVDCVALLDELRRIRHSERAREYPRAVTLSARLSFPIDTHLVEFNGMCDLYGIPKGMRGLARRLWEMDHVIPVVEGGGECGLEGLQTLCISCHRRKTTSMISRRALERRR